jgi:hypothetical protein
LGEKNLLNWAMAVYALNVTSAGIPSVLLASSSLLIATYQIILSIFVQIQ